MLNRVLFALSLAASFASASEPLGASSNDEASCIYRLARTVLDGTAWSHLLLEDSIYYRDPIRSERTYTVYAVSRDNSPQDFKVQLNARWVREGSPRRCELTGAAVISSSEAHRVLVRRVDGHFDELSPALFPLSAIDEPTPLSAEFSRERTYGQPNVTVRPADTRISFDQQTTEMLSRQSLYFSAELGAAWVAGYFQPERLRWRLLRRVGRAALYADAASRVYLVMSGDRDPGIFALGRFTTEGIPQIVRALQDSTEVTGMLRVPRSYLRQFYGPTGTQPPAR